MSIFTRDQHPPISAATAELAESFWRCLECQDADGAMAMVHESASVFIPPAGIHGGRHELDGFVRATANAFPDLMAAVTSSFTASDGAAVLTIHFQGTQAADWLGIINQEKFLDIRQAWRFNFESEKIVSVRGYWDQN